MKKDSIIALATAIDNTPYVRSVDAFYEDGAFYVLTHGLSGKMKQVFSAWIDNRLYRIYTKEKL